METLTPKGSASVIVNLIREAQFYEENRNYAALGAIIKPYYQDIEAGNPNFRNLPAPFAAALLRVVGVYLVLFGKSQSRMEWMARGKELISEAVTLFDRLELDDFANEARLKLGSAYDQEGAIEEAAPYWLEVIANYKTDQLHTNYLKASANMLLVYHSRADIQTAVEIIRDIEIGIELTTDTILSSVFHLNSAMIMRRFNREKALRHYNECTRISREAGCTLTLQLNLNNQTFYYLDDQDYPAAHRVIDEAIEIATMRNEPGYLGDFIDSKVQIYLKELKYPESLPLSNQAVEMLELGDKKAYLNALWVNVQCHLLNDLKVEAIEIFNKLIALSAVHLGFAAVKKFTKDFADMVKISNPRNFQESVNSYEKEMIVSALKTTNLDIYKAADILKLSPFDLTRKLDEQHPELYQELGIIRGARFLEIEETEQRVKEAKEINILTLDPGTFRFAPEIDVPEGKIRSFYFSEDVMKSFFKVKADAIVAVAPSHNADPGMMFLIKLKKEDQYFVGRIYYERDLNLIYFMDFGKTISYPLKDVKHIGIPFAWSDMVNVDDKTLNFEPLPDAYE